MKHTKTLLTLFLLAAFTSATLAQEYKTISKEEYLDKTRACILSQVAGVLTGFEFVWNGSVPYIGMPDEWFKLCEGPYGGGEKHGAAGDNFVEAPGRIYPDDDYHVDFFNQLIYDKIGPQPSHSDIADMWKLYQVNDWGGGFSAMEIINKRGFIPPFTGRYEYGNQYGWCTEAYIENETVGCVYPGMPATASIMTDRFASVTGDFESQLWGKFYGTAYALAYFETDAITTIKKASAVFHPGSWAKRIFDLAFELHQKYPDDWRRAAKELESYRRHVFQIDNILTSYDINGGFTILSLLYGNNDYYNTMKIASLSGYDAECTAATATGLLGILQGMKALPEKINEVIWLDGEGKYVNASKYVPHINRNYPYEQKFDDIARLYASNTEKIIEYYGGEVTDTHYKIKSQEVIPSRSLYIENADFESGESNLHISGKSGGDGAVGSNIPAHNGKSFARVMTKNEGAEGRMYFKVSGLTPGDTYRLSGYLAAGGKNQARLFAEGATTPYTYTSVYGSPDLAASAGNNLDKDSKKNAWYYRSMIFVAQDEEIHVGLHGINQTGSTENYYLDDLMLEAYPLLVLKTINPDDPTAGSIPNIEATVDKTDDYIMRICYANTTEGLVSASFTSISTNHGNIGFPATGSTAE